MPPGYQRGWLGIGRDPAGIQQESSRDPAWVPRSAEELQPGTPWVGSFFQLLPNPQNTLKYLDFPLRYQSGTWRGDRAVPSEGLGAPGWALPVPSGGSFASVAPGCS